jgi:hypothetical protein
MKRMMLVMLLMVAGCQAASNPQKLDVTAGVHTEIVKPSVALVSSDPQIKPVIVAGGRTTVDVQPRSITAAPQAWRVVTPFGPAPGESVSKMSDKPLQSSGGESPGMTVTADGMGMTKGELPDMKGQTGQFGIFDTIVQRAKDWGLILGGVLLIGGLVVVVLKIVGKYVPAVGTFLSSAAAEIQHVAGSTVAKVVTGVQKAKTEIADLIDSHPATAALPAASKTQLASDIAATLNTTIQAQTGSGTPEAAAIAQVKDSKSM